MQVLRYDRIYIMENNTKTNTLSTPAAIVVAGFLIMIAILVAKMPAKNEVLVDKNKAEIETPADNTEVIPISPITTEDHVLGDINTAELTIVEYSDLECPYCKNFHKTIQNAIKRYPGKIAWVYRHFPLDSLHSKARNEARATECVSSIGGNDKFWQYLDMIFANTPANDGLDAKQLPIFANKVGVDKAKFAKCLASTEMDAKVEADYQDGLRIGVRGTPHTILILGDGTQLPIMGADENKFNTALSTLFQ